jgi:hypothetical protein
MKWNHTTDSPVAEAWLAQQAGRFGGKLQPLVNELLLAVAEGRMADPAPLAARVAELERQNTQLYVLLQRAMGAAEAGGRRQEAEAGGRRQEAGSQGLQFTK